MSKKDATNFRQPHAIISPCHQIRVPEHLAQCVALGYYREHVGVDAGDGERALGAPVGDE